MSQETMYTGEQPVVDAEVERLKKFDWPNQISAQVIPADLHDGKFLDVGAGPGKQMKEIVEGRHGHYVAADLNLQLLKARDGHRVQAHATALPFDDNAFDDVHSRFMLMHMNAADRTAAIQEMARVGKPEHRYIVEYDWQAWEDRLQVMRRDLQNKDDAQKALNVMDRFIRNSQDFAAKIGAELAMGQKLPGEVTAALGVDTAVTEKRFEREPGDYYAELIQLATMTEQFWKQKIKDKFKAQEMSDIIFDLKGLEGDSRIHFSPVDIVAVTF